MHGVVRCPPVSVRHRRTTTNPREVINIIDTQMPITQVITSSASAHKSTSFTTIVSPETSQAYLDFHQQDDLCDTEQTTHDAQTPPQVGIDTWTGKPDAKLLSIVQSSLPPLSPDLSTRTLVTSPTAVLLNKSKPKSPSTSSKEAPRKATTGVLTNEEKWKNSLSVLKEQVSQLEHVLHPSKETIHFIKVTMPTVLHVFERARLLSQQPSNSK
jgi:hypothetical protein